MASADYWLALPAYKDEAALTRRSRYQSSWSLEIVAARVTAAGGQYVAFHSSRKDVVFMKIGSVAVRRTYVTPSQDSFSLSPRRLRC